MPEAVTIPGACERDVVGWVEAVGIELSISEFGLSDPSAVYREVDRW